MGYGLYLRSAAAALVGAGLLAASPALAADTTIKWLHLEQSDAVLAEWEAIAAAYEEMHPGVDIEFQFLENEAFKAKLPTLLQSDDAPSIFYTWGGGVLKEQSLTGAIRPVTPAFDANPEWRDSISAAAIDGMSFGGRAWAVPYKTGVVSFFYNKALLEQAGVDGTAIHTWADFTAAVEKLKAAGITPIAVGGGDKWPVHFYWSYLAMRVAGKDAFEAAKNNEGEGFAGEPFVRAAGLLAELGAMEPFQDGWLGASWSDHQATFNNGRAAFTLSFENTATPDRQARQAEDGVGLAQDNIGRFPFPTVEGGAGLITDDFGGLNGWVVTTNAPPETEDFLKFFTNLENMTRLAEVTGILPVVKGAEAGVSDPTMMMAAEQMAVATWHQNYVDQDLGPNVGRVVNDMSVEIAAGQLSPEEAEAEIQSALAMEM